MNLQKIAAASVLAVILSACASSNVLIGTARDPIPEEQVKVLIEAPAKYETVALLEASDLGAGPSAQSRMNKVINRLKAEAAALGANAILLQGFDTQVIGSVSSGQANTSFSGDSANTSAFGYTGARTSKVGNAIAIYIPRE